MQQLDGEVAGHKAMVIDANPASRSVLLQNLREFGFATVKAMSRIADARDVLERRPFEVVICDLHFESSRESGQDLLEELRREQLLPFSTVFVMVTSEATYQRVAEAAEAALDSYLVKPFSANTLMERLREARQRKRALREIFLAMDAHQHERAAQLCLDRFEKRQLYWLYAARIGAELLLNLKRNEEAKRLYDAVIAAKTVPWARLGVARAELAEGQTAQARRTLEVLLGEAPQYADSYDVLGKVQMEQGQMTEALATYRTASSLTPGCILRMQHCGTLSFYAGDTAAATQMLERTWQTGQKSRLFDVLSMMLLAYLRFDDADSKGLDQCNEVLRRFALNHPQSLRLRRMADLGRILSLLLLARTDEGLERTSSLAEERSRPDFDMEAATNLLSLLVRAVDHGLPLSQFEALVRAIARRFCVSKATTEVLLAATRRAPRAAEWIRTAQAEILQRAEAAMNHAVNGQPSAAVESLLSQGRETGNAKLIEMAGLVARRHRERIPNADALLEAAAMLSHRYCAPATHIAGVRRSNRSAGGLVLRR